MKWAGEVDSSSQNLKDLWVILNNDFFFLIISLGEGGPDHISVPERSGR